MDEVKDKSGKDIDVRSWKQEYVEDLPEQKNGCVSFSTIYISLQSYRNIIDSMVTVSVECLFGQQGIFLHNQRKKRRRQKALHLLKLMSKSYFF